MTNAEIILSLIMGLCAIIGTLCAWIFNTTINTLKEDLNEIGGKITDLEKADTAHTMGDERRFNSIEILLAKRDGQYEEILSKINQLMKLMESVLQEKKT